MMRTETKNGDKSHPGWVTLTPFTKHRKTPDLVGIRAVNLLTADSKGKAQHNNLIETNLLLFKEVSSIAFAQAQFVKKRSPACSQLARNASTGIYINT